MHYKLKFTFLLVKNTATYCKNDNDYNSNSSSNNTSNNSSHRYIVVTINTVTPTITYAIATAYMYVLKKEVLNLHTYLSKCIGNTIITLYVCFNSMKILMIQSVENYKYFQIY